MLNLYDEFTGKSFVISSKKNFKIFNCGPTVNDFIHIGHIRNALLPDILKRVLNEIGIEEVTYISNVSNISTKIYERSKKETKFSWKEIGDYFTQQWLRDLIECNILVPNIIMPDTEHVSSIIEFIRKLISENIAYELNGSVYYKISCFKELIETMVDIADKTELNEAVINNSEDFILWEAVTDRDDMLWESPWGKGRPGKHIPCSDVIREFCNKDDVIIHCAGNDLYYHHSCEIAQNISVNKGESVADVWIYNALVNVDDKKMGKSFGNSVSVREVLTKYNPDVLKWYLLSTNFTEEITFCDSDLADAYIDWLEVSDRLKPYMDGSWYIADRILYEEVMKKVLNKLETQEILLILKKVIIENLNKEKSITAGYLLKMLGFQL